MELHPTALSAHGLGAVLYASGDVEAAAEVELRSVQMEPANTRYRWALVASLRKLGREKEAREHAARTLEIEPDVPAHRERFGRLFGGR